MAATVIAVMMPVALDRASFPLSTYPIYAHQRDRTEQINVVSGVRADGSTVPVGLDAIARTDDPLIAQSTIDHAIAAGATDRMCSDIAARVDEGSDDGVVAVEIASELQDLVERARGRESALERSIVTRCPVP